MTTYIIKLDYGRVGTQYATLAEEDYRVKFAPVHKTKRVINGPLGPMRELEQVGVKKSELDVFWSSAAVTNGRGGNATRCQSHRFRVLDAHKHVRVLDAEDLALLADHDREIAELIDKLNKLRDERAAAVAKIWRSAGKVGIGDLEDKAKARLS